MALFETFFVIIAAIKLIKSALNSSTEKLAREQTEIEEFRRTGIEELKNKVRDKSRKVKLDILHEAKRTYVDKSNVYYNLSREFDLKIKNIKTQMSDLNEYKNKLYSSKQHDELKKWTDKSKELREKFDDLVTDFKKMDAKTKEFNSIVQVIKSEIDKIE